MESIQIMRRLVSAIEVGPTFHQYGNLLIETKIAVDERIAILRGESRVLVADALKAFIDAHDLWRLAIVHDSAPIYISYSSISVSYSQHARNSDAILQHSKLQN